MRTIMPQRRQCAAGLFVMLALALLGPTCAGAADAVSVPAPSHTPARTVLVFGDSLSAAYQLRPEQGWVTLLGERIAREQPGWRVVNASVSGETTAGGAARIARALSQHRPAVVVVELGANDALRGLPLEQTRANLDRIVQASAAHGARVLLLGMRIPPNYGSDYAQGFERMYADIATRRGSALLPFLLEPIAFERDAFQDDNLHPTAAAQPRLLAHVWPALAPLLATPDGG